MTGAREESTRRTGGAGRARWAPLTVAAVAAAVAAAGCPLTDDFVISGGAPGGTETSASAGGAPGVGGGMAGTGAGMAGAGAGAGGDTGAGGAGGSGCLASPEACNGVDDDCDGQIDNGAMCPCDHRLDGGHAYLFCGPAQSWAIAENACSVFQYHLVTIDSQQENDFVFDVARNQLSFTRWYIGFSDMDLENTWIWADGTPAAYTNWHPVNATEPNGGTSENCAEMGFYDDGTWDDINCNNAYSYVCEADGG